LLASIPSAHKTIPVLYDFSNIFMVLEHELKVETHVPSKHFMGSSEGQIGIAHEDDCFLHVPSAQRIGVFESHPLLRGQTFLTGMQLPSSHNIYPFFSHISFTLCSSHWFSDSAQNPSSHLKGLLKGHPFFFSQWFKSLTHIPFSH
jgi:hypothetical protein